MFCFCSLAVLQADNRFSHDRYLNDLYACASNSVLMTPTVSRMHPIDGLFPIGSSGMAPRLCGISGLTVFPPVETNTNKTSSSTEEPAADDTTKADDSRSSASDSNPDNQ